MPSRIDDLASSHQAVADNTLQPLYDSPFDPVDFLDDTLSIPSFTSHQQPSSKNGRLPQIQAASSQIQALLSKLNAHNSRCSSSLTQLTDEILRSGSRLAYEVEILRGDVNSLYDVLTEALQDDIQKFIMLSPAALESGGGDVHVEVEGEQNAELITDVNEVESQDPEFIAQLRMLGQVKARLESVIKAFGDAMQWPLPPSELSVTSSLISVSAPELGMIETSDDQKAQAVSKKFRAEVVDLLDSEGASYAGLEAAMKRVDHLRDLASVWKGTAEEKARTRFVDGLAKLVEDRKKVLDARSAQQRPRRDSLTQRSSSMPVRSAPGRIDSGNPAAGLFRNLQKLRDEIYLD